MNALFKITFWNSKTHIFSINAHLKEGVEAAHHLVSEVIAEEIEQAKLGARQVLIFTFHPWFFSDDSLGRFSIAVFSCPGVFLRVSYTALIFHVAIVCY